MVVSWNSIKNKLKPGGFWWFHEAVAAPVDRREAPIDRPPPLHEYHQNPPGFNLFLYRLMVSSFLAKNIPETTKNIKKINETRSQKKRNARFLFETTWCLGRARGPERGQALRSNIRSDPRAHRRYQVISFFLLFMNSTKVSNFSASTLVNTTKSSNNYPWIPITKIKKYEWFTINPSVFLIVDKIIGPLFYNHQER